MPAERPITMPSGSERQSSSLEQFLEWETIAAQSADFERAMMPLTAIQQKIRLKVLQALPDAF
jgi:hypothetical protein